MGHKFKVLFFLSVMISLPLTQAEAKKALPQHPKPAVQLIPVLPPLLANYDIYVGGIHLVQAHVWFKEEGSSYLAVVRANTAGFWGRLFPWETILNTSGRIDGDQFVPQQFYTRDQWDHKPKITRLTFDGKGGVTPEFDPPSHDKNREIVTEAQRRGALDPVTALLQMLAHVAVQNSCTVPVPVFDGKRRFDITGRDGGYDDINSEDYGVFSGKARLCHVDFRMISGEWKDGEHARFWKKTENEPGREPFHIWLASPNAKLPELPVRLESGSIAGLVIGHLSSWRYVSEAEFKSQLP